LFLQFVYEYKHTSLFVLSKVMVAKTQNKTSRHTSHKELLARFQVPDFKAIPNIAKAQNRPLLLPC